MNHERFIIGQGESGRMYITHTEAPRFVAELFDDDDTRGMSIAGLSMSIDETGEVLANFSWIDDPGACDLHALRTSIAQFLVEYDFRAEREIEAAENEDD